MLLVGQALAWAHAHHWLHRVLEPGARVLAEGRIVSIPERDGGSWRFELRTQRLDGAREPAVPRLLRVQWRDPHVEPRAGERWRLLLKLQPLEETRNFAGLDAARFAFREGVHGSGRVLPSAMNELLLLAPASLDTVRARIATRVRESIADPDAASLVSALAVGVTSAMSRDQWRVFNATGTTHLVAISGLHITMFAWLAFRLARGAWRHSMTRMVPAREPFALLLGLAAAGGYSLLAGLSVPTLRTWLMLALYVGARLMSRRVGSGRLWAMALIVVLLTDARAPLAAGFWLSFIAVGVLLAFAGDEQGESTGWRAALRVQMTVMLALIPASLAIFGGLSIVGLGVNLVAIPVISLVFVPVVLAGALAAWLAPAIDGPFFTLAAQLYEWLWPAMVWCADAESVPAVWRGSPSGWWFVLAVPASLVWLCRWPWPLRLTASCALLPLLFAPDRSPEPGLARIDVLDAGRGATVLVRTRHHTLLFDTGDAWNTHGARLAGVVLPALDAAQVRGVDRLLLPTLDDDRASGAALLAQERGLAEAWAVAPWPGNGMAVRCRDARWTWDGVRFDAWSLARHCLLRISAGRASLLMSGDLDARGEQAMVDKLGGALASDVVVMGRQASEIASSPQWIENTAPGLAVATGGIEGAQSRRRVIDRWRRVARVLDTRRDGGIRLQLGDQGVEVLAMAGSGRFPFHWRRPV
jgi:competence protein ComEC